MKFDPIPWIFIALAFAVAAWLRYSVVENSDLGFYCDSGGASQICMLRWLTIQSFNSHGLGYAGLFLGILATVTRSATLGALAGIVGIAGLVLYTWDYSGVGFLLGVLVLSRTQLEDYRYQDRSREREA
jgi:hypothetical protein